MLKRWTKEEIEELMPVSHQDICELGWRGGISKETSLPFHFDPEEGKGVGEFGKDYGSYIPRPIYRIGCGWSEYPIIMSIHLFEPNTYYDTIRLRRFEPVIFDIRVDGHVQWHQYEHYCYRGIINGVDDLVRVMSGMKILPKEVRIRLNRDKILEEYV